MTFVRANAFGWGLFELLTSAQMNVIDSQMPYALDGRYGGAYNPDAPIIVNGAAVVGGAAVQLTDSATFHALQVTSSDTGGIRVTGPSKGTAGQPNELLTVIGRASTADQGGSGGSFTGGATTDPGSSGGSALLLVGGAGDAVGTIGGRAATATAGKSDLTGLGPSVGATAFQITAPTNTIGDDVAQIAGIGLGINAPSMTGTGFGGWGLVVAGGLGGSASAVGTDVGLGVLSVGAPGLHGISAPLLAGLPAEFESVFGNQAGVRASGQSVGRAFLSEFSGSSAASELNKFALIGTPSNATIVRIDSSPTAVPGGLTTALQISSGVNAGSFLGMLVTGRENQAARFSSTGGGGGVNQHAAIQLLTSAFVPDVLDQGGITYLDQSHVTGLLQDAFFIGHGPGTAYYDRVVGSADRAAAWAWGKFTTDGVGGNTLGSNYGSASVSNTGTFVATVVLDAIEGQPSNLIVVAMCEGGSGNPRFVVATPVISAYPTGNSIQFSVITSNTGAAINLNTTALTVHYMVFGPSSFGTVADRPTFYRP